MRDDSADKLAVAGVLDFDSRALDFRISRQETDWLSVTHTGEATLGALIHQALLLCIVLGHVIDCSYGFGGIDIRVFRGQVIPDL